MKKLLTAILVLVYFTVSTGFVVSLHYCMDELASTGLGAKSDKTCNKCGMETDGLCCWDDVKLVKLQVQHTVAQAFVAQFSFPAVITSADQLLLSPAIIFKPGKIIQSHSPPPDGQDTYLFNRVFRC